MSSVDKWFKLCARQHARERQRASVGRKGYSDRYWGIWNTDGDDTPYMLFWNEDDARRELARRRGLDPSDDDWMDHHYEVFSTDIVGAWCNAPEVDPRANARLSPAEIMLVLEMSHEAGRAVRLPGEISRDELLDTLDRLIIEIWARDAVK
jgi:hypothetical protein